MNFSFQKDACGQIGIGPACCTNEILNSYAVPFGTELQALYDTELNHLARTLTKSKQQIDVWSEEYTTELRRLTISSLETLFGTKEYRLNIHQSLVNLFNTLNNHHSSTDNVSKSTIDLFNHLIISLYRQFMIKNNQYFLDDKLQKCLLNKAFDINALSTKRELLYILTSGSSLIHILHTMLIYIDADIQRLKLSAKLISNPCIERFAKETLCPICVSISFSTHHSNTNNNELLCKDDCQNVIKKCFNQTNNSYILFASMIKTYSTIVQDIERSVIELKLVERLSKLHIYLYDMVVKAINSRHIYTQLQNACPNSDDKPFTPILSLPPTINERRELVVKWNRSLHFLFKQLHLSIDNLYLKFTQQIITDICSNPNYASRSNQCTQINKQTTNLFQWPLESIPQSTINTNNIELTRNQLDDLKKKMIPIQQMIISLRPKEKNPLLIEHLPDFGSYDDDVDDGNIMNDIDTQSSLFIETYDNDLQESLSERIYKEIDEQTTDRSRIPARKSSKQTNKSQSIIYSIQLYLIIFILHQILFIS
ncbi:unnamed protein product [Adineta steineri]|uniref:Uncharacterized protein n=1 Tax=Adineta steineri TaxID=433720 RepID=A0A814PBP2_9BILA|nr:unnamed protein product [Adineta steineri]CAF3760591.1 unnamed protein product [Adineta steineri]